MSEEEKEAIEYINNYIEKFKVIDNSTTYKKEDIWNYFKFEHYKKIDTILNLVDKLKEENEVLKEELFVERETHISKYTIKNKIKELEDIKNKNIEYCSKDFFQLERTIKVLKELLGE